MQEMIDHTLLKQDATLEQIDQLCEDALEYQFAAVCVNPVWVSHAVEKLKGSKINVCTVIGFPLGACTTEVKRFEAMDAIQNGACEIDMVINLGWLKSGRLEDVKEDIEAVVEAVEEKAIVKVILETALLTTEEIGVACQIAKEAGAAFVKTSTGFGPGGATVEAVQQMRQAVGPDFGVKASGGIRDLESAERLVEAGANRLGCSASVAIVKVALEKGTLTISSGID